MKAIVRRKNGLVLVIPKIGFAPMLFLEWISEKNIIHKVTNTNENFEIRMETSLNNFIDVKDFINLNI